MIGEGGGRHIAWLDINEGINISECMLLAFSRSYLFKLTGNSFFCTGHRSRGTTLHESWGHRNFWQLTFMTPKLLSLYNFYGCIIWWLTLSSLGWFLKFVSKSQKALLTWRLFQASLSLSSFLKHKIMIITLKSGFIDIFHYI